MEVVTPITSLWQPRSKRASRSTAGWLPKDVQRLAYSLKNMIWRASLWSIFFGILYVILLYKIYYLLNSRSYIFLELYSFTTGLFLLSRFPLAFFYEDDHSVTFADDRYPSVSFVIACKDEEDSIYKTIATCLDSKYPGKMECIAVDDGSTDKTYKEMLRCKKKYGRAVRVISFSKNKGKREAMAEGVLVAKGEIVIFVDSDSFVKPNAVKLIVEHFLTDEQVGAVSGNSLVENIKTNALTKMQSARYGVSFDVFKACESVFGTVTCCPGCFSAYRRVAIMNVLDRWRNQSFLGTRSTFGDDRSLTNYVLRTWKVIYCRSALASTIVPEHYKKFFKQQLRWKKSWIREGMNAGSFIWKKNPLASISFYINLFVPIFGPLIVIRALVWDMLIRGHAPVFFVGGILAMSLLFGIYYYLISMNKYWWYVMWFTLIYTIVLIWQMPYALVKLRDTSWGTR